MYMTQAMGPFGLGESKVDRLTVKHVETTWFGALCFPKKCVDQAFRILWPEFQQANTTQRTQPAQ
jgi:hypothetical protein